MDEYQGSEGDYLIYLLHAATYDFARGLVAGREVLDFGCGTGYGTAGLAESAARVVGVDVSGAAVDHARQHYRRENLDFGRIGPIEDEALPFATASFDVVVSLQVIEHIGAVDRYLAEIRRVLRPDGVFLCATPDRSLRLFPGQRPWNEFHVTEYSPAALADTLRRVFPAVRLYGMTAAPRVLAPELRRYRRTRLLTYPVTFPGIPDRWRLAGVRRMKRMIGGRSAGSDRARAPRSPFGSGPGDILIAPGVAPSVNVVAVAGAGD